MRSKYYSWGEVESPLREALKAIAGVEPPEDAYLTGAYSCDDMSDQDVMDLQDWCSYYANPPWATGLWMLESAEQCVMDAIDNANIPDKEIPNDEET